MDIKEYIQKLIPEIDSPEKVYEFFRGLGYSNILDPSYKRKIEEFEFAKEEKEKVKDIYTVFNYEGKLQIFLIETKAISAPFVRYLTKHLSDRYLRFLLILTSDYKEFTFVFPEFERIEEGKHKLKLTRLILDRGNAYHTDLLTISNLALTGDEENWRDIWKRWKDAFSVEKVTDTFFEDYKNAFFELRKIFEKQKIPVKSAHELSQQFLNRLMFLYFIAKKKWLNNDSKFIKWYWERYKEERRKDAAKDNTFYENWLRVLFLEAFNNNPGFKNSPFIPPDVKRILSDAPYLNGGLFHRNELDELPFSISDSLFEKVFAFFEKYNFTIREELPLDVEVAVDPQMIGYVYESLSNVAEEIYERQDLGIFYTPTIEVDFMCRRTVVEYLTNHLASPSPLSPPVKGGDNGEGEGYHINKEWIYKLLFDEDKKAVAEHISKQKLWYRLEELLDNLAVVDPACGSGAFLVGMLHVLAELYRLIYSHIKREMTEFELKKKIIGNSLYGVDVMPWAVHSAELRLWLQLIIEEDIPYEKRKLYPLLPNLTLRLRVGDSLVQEVGGVSLHVRDSNLSSSLKGKLTSLKREKEKFYNNDPTAKFKDDKLLLQEELRIFGELLDDKIINLQKENQSLEVKKRKLQYELFEMPEKKKSEQKSLFEELIKANEKKIEDIRETKRKIQGKKPFIWDIDFAEIFGDKGGFDIVIGNPPYVRQEKIAPPNKLKAEVTLEDKREYKDKLLSSIQVHYPFVKKLDKKSDYYIYFYFHGLSLLNEKGIFCFITSNSWLDVEYGKELQEFLLKYCSIKAIYNNEAKKSFEHADVNTVIALFGPPNTEKPSLWPALNEKARFVMFKRRFEEVVNHKNLVAIEGANTIQKTELYRVYPVKQETLLEEGWERPEELEAKENKAAKPILLREKFQTGKYEGNKWGGIYLRSPDVFYKLVNKEELFVPLSSIAEIQYGLKTGLTEFFYITDKKQKEWGIEDEFLIPFVTSTQELENYVLNPKKTEIKLFVCSDAKATLRKEGKTNALKYIEWGEKQKTKKGAAHTRAGVFFPAVPSVSGNKPWYSIRDKKCGDFVMPALVRERYFFAANPHSVLVSNMFYQGIVNNSVDKVLIWAGLNSTITYFFQELLGRPNIGGRLNFYGLEFKHLLIPNPNLLNKNRETLKRTYEKFSSTKIDIISLELKKPEKQLLDDIVRTSLGISIELWAEISETLKDLIYKRIKKEDSLRREYAGNIN